MYLCQSTFISYGEAAVLLGLSVRVCVFCFTVWVHVLPAWLWLLCSQCRIVWDISASSLYWYWYTSVDTFRRYLAIKGPPSQKKLQFLPMFSYDTEYSVEFQDSLYTFIQNSVKYWHAFPFCWLHMRTKSPYVLVSDVLL